MPIITELTMDKRTIRSFEERFLLFGLVGFWDDGIIYTSYISERMRLLGIFNLLSSFGWVPSRHTASCHPWLQPSFLYPELYHTSTIVRKCLKE